MFVVVVIVVVSAVKVDLFQKIHPKKAVTIFLLPTLFYPDYHPKMAYTRKEDTLKHALL